MAEDPKKLTRAHKIALGIISAACCCLIGISAFALAAPDALNQGNLAEATQQTNSASTDYGNDVPQETFGALPLTEYIQPLFPPYSNSAKPPIALT